MPHKRRERIAVDLSPPTVAVKDASPATRDAQSGLLYTFPYDGKRYGPATLYVNKNDQPIAPASVQTPPPPPTLTAPQNVSVAALSTTTAQLSWSAVSGTQGYRIFQVNGSQSVLLGTVSATTTSAQINGLTPGARESFKVEAYNATATADSQIVSVTMPTALAAPIVTATATPPTAPAAK